MAFKKWIIQNKILMMGKLGRNYTILTLYFFNVVLIDVNSFICSMYLNQCNNPFCSFKYAV